jgi:hypothetical protein
MGMSPATRIVISGKALDLAFVKRVAGEDKYLAIVLSEHPLQRRRKQQ